jgi:hypothetical protein
MDYVTVKHCMSQENTSLYLQRIRTETVHPESLLLSSSDGISLSENEHLLYTSTDGLQNNTVFY